MAEGIIIRRGIAPAEVVEYIAATGGTTLEYNESGKRYKSHTFTSSGNFVVNTLGNGERNDVDYLIIAGGGSGGNGTDGIRSGGGGGAGGYKTTNGTSGGNSTAESKVTVNAQSYGITIGAGGSGVQGDFVTGNSGVNSSAFEITSNGGGHGGSARYNSIQGASGGSGGGAGNSISGGAGTGITSQGHNGGSAGNIQSGIFPGAGGGGAGGVGQSTTNDSFVPQGGPGLSNTLRTGSLETRGLGGGTVGPSATPGANAAFNTGNGGQGSSGGSARSGNGGSGIVIIRYEIAPSA